MSETDAHWRGTVDAFMRESAEDRREMHDELHTLAERSNAQHVELMRELRESRHELRDAAQQMVNALAVRVSNVEGEQREWQVTARVLKGVGSVAGAVAMAIGAAVGWVVNHFVGKGS